MAYLLSETAQSIEWLSLIKQYKDVFIVFLDFEVNDQYQISIQRELDGQQVYLGICFKFLNFFFSMNNHLVKKTSIYLCFKI